MSKDALREVRKELDKTRAIVRTKDTEIQQLMATIKLLEMDVATYKDAARKHVSEVDKAKTEATVRAKQQIEQLRSENAELLTQMAIATEQVTKITAVVADMTERMAAKTSAEKELEAQRKSEPPAPKMIKPRSKDRVRRSQRS